MKRLNTYRLVTNEHAYSHLKSFKAKLFLQSHPYSFKYKDGEWYKNVADNAYMYVALEMACGRVEYIP